MNDCSNHTKEVAGITDMKLLAEKIGDLHYESLAQLFKHLGEKIDSDGKKDYNNNKLRLGNKLITAGFCIRASAIHINEAWQISKPFMESKLK